MTVFDLEKSAGYAVKRAQASITAAMETQLRPLGIGVAQYACLVALNDTPEISNAELARRVFVTRQATHQLLASMARSELLQVAGAGRAMRLSLTDRGRDVLREAVDIVTAIEKRMFAHLDETALSRLAADLNQSADNLDVDAR